MDKLNFEFFDFFGAVLPGVPAFLIACFIVPDMSFSYDAIAVFLKGISVYQALIMIFACYATGFCLHYPAYELFQVLAGLWGSKRTLGLPISIGKREVQLVVIRQKSPENFKLISKFMALRQMAYSMLFSLLVFFAGLLLLTFFKGSWNREIIVTGLFALLFSVLFLRRAVAFHQRIQEMITEAHTFAITLP
jgi:hypothetical protein